MAKKHMKKMLTIPGLKRNEIQNHVKLPPVKIATIKNTANNKC
jgi:hypothetical protein